MTPSYALVDCNNFYVSCERVFRPAMNGKPVIVLSNNDGCVVARSNEAKQLGVKMAQPVYQARDLIERYGIHCFSSNYALYADMAHRVMQTLATLAPVVEIYSVDEAFLDLRGAHVDGAAEFGRRVRERVGRWTGIPVSVGIAPTKTLAKIANEVAKKERADGVCDLAEENVDELLARIPVRDVWGIGWRHASKLRQSGIRTALDLREARIPWIQRRMSVSGVRTVLELRGTACIPVDDVRGTRKSLICTRSFGTKLKNAGDVREAVAAFASRVGEKLRRNALAAGFLSVYVVIAEETGTWRERLSRSASAPLAEPTSFTPELVRSALALLEECLRDDYTYYKAGVMAYDLRPVGSLQANCFAPSSCEPRHRALMEALDRINGEWGSGTLRIAATGTARRWGMKQEKRSPNYTTRWEELLTVRVAGTNSSLSQPGQSRFRRIV